MKPKDAIERSVRLELARAHYLFSLGKVLTPEEVQNVIEEHGGPQVAGWVLFGGVHPEMYELASQTKQVTQRISVEKARSGYCSLLVVQQIGDWQHRLLIPIVGISMKRFLNEWRVNPFFISLGAPGNQLSLLTHCHIAECVNIEVVDASTAMVDFDEVTTEMFGRAHELLQADNLNRVGDCEVEFACVTVSIPPEYQRLIAKREMESIMCV